MTERYRIRDLLTGRTLIKSNYGRDLVAYHEAHFERGRSDWLWQYRRPDKLWAEIPLQVRRAWRGYESGNQAERSGQAA